MQEDVPNPYVELTLEKATVLLSKEKVIRILKKELRRNLSRDIKSDKQQLLDKLETSSADLVLISIANQVELGAINSIADKLLSEGNAIVRISSGEKSSQIKIKREYLLFGSYRRSIVLMDGELILVTDLKLGE